MAHHAQHHLKAEGEGEPVERDPPHSAAAHCEAQGEEKDEALRKYGQKELYKEQRTKS